MKIRSIQTCIMSSLLRCIFRCSVSRYVILVSFFNNLLFDCNFFVLVVNKYLLSCLYIQVGNKGGCKRIDKKSTRTEA